MAGKPAAALILCSFVLLFGCSEKKTVQTVRTVPVKAGNVSTMDVPVQITSIGKVEPPVTVSVKSRVDGTIVGVYFKQGDDVKTGQKLFQIDPRPFEAALHQAESQLVRDAAQAQYAEKEATRYKTLVEKDYVPKDQYEQLRSASEAAAAVVKADQANIQAARLQLEYSSIKSPIDGRVGSILVNLGNTVKATDIPMLTINKISPIYVTFSVPEQSLADIRKYMAQGELITEAVIPGDEERPVKGALTFIDNTIDSATGTIQLKSTFDNNDRRLWPGQFINVVLTLFMDRNATVLPTTAVQASQEGQYIFVIKPDSTVERRNVVVPRTFKELSVVAEGAKAGEQVVTDGQIQLVPGVKVRVQEAQASTQNKPTKESTNTPGSSGRRQ